MIEMTLIITLGAIAFIGSVAFLRNRNRTYRSSRPLMHQLEQRGNRNARLVNRLHERQAHLIGTILIGNNLINILVGLGYKYQSRPRRGRDSLRDPDNRTCGNVFKSSLKPLSRIRPGRTKGCPCNPAYCFSAIAFYQNNSSVVRIALKSLASD